VTPDDLVILAFSGHGYTDPKGRFYLLPSDSGTESAITDESESNAHEGLLVQPPWLRNWFRERFWKRPWRRYSEVGGCGCGPLSSPGTCSGSFE
jgi:hypothetical protein